jgi:hypothetical protein
VIDRIRISVPPIAAGRLSLMRTLTALAQTDACQRL